MSRKTLSLALLGLTALVSVPQQAHAQTKSVLTTLYRFDGNPGRQSQGPLAVGPDGTLYGSLEGVDTTGGEAPYGTVYAFQPTSLKYKTLYTFNVGDSNSPGDNIGDPTPLFYSPADGMLYGGASSSDSDYRDLGGLFRLSTDSKTYNDLHDFSGYSDDNEQNYDGDNPSGPPILASDGNYYGTAADVGRNGVGSLYKITPSGTFSVLYSFDYYTAGYPQGRLIEGPDGALYGGVRRATRDGSFTNAGLYKVTKGGAFTLLHGFKSDGSEGFGLAAPLALGADGALYGTAEEGGITEGNDGGGGVVFRITSSGKFAVLHKFSKDGHGLYPLGLTLGANGNFYGVTSEGSGTSINGTVYEMTPAGAVTTLYRFHTAFDGISPTGVVFGPDGALYGTTYGGGAKGYGTIFKLTLPQ